jgi:two-component system alkaline phosphatase synthesis response regulator PhoP
MSKKGNILLVEDEENLHHTLKLNLELEGYEITSAYNGTQAIQAFEKEYFDLIVMDVMMPEIDGLQATETIRVHNSETPILILSAKASGSDRVAGLKKGADDYLTKPFHLEELLLRVEKLVDKNKKIQTKENTLEEDNVTIGTAKVDFKAQTATTWQGELVSLSSKEAMLLKLLIANKNEVVTREKILQVVWGYNVYPNTRTIDNFILNFRKYFEPDSRHPQYFHSVRGMGYKFTP